MIFCRVERNVHRFFGAAAGAGRSAALVAAVAAGLAVGACGDARSGGLPPEPELEALIDSMLPRIAELAALEVRGPVRIERRSRNDVRAFVEERLHEEYPDDELDALRLTYVALGLIPDTLDLRALYLDLYTEQVIGYYDPRTERLYLVEGVPRSALRPVLVHELVHALQDQHTNLDSLVARERGNDRQTAAHAALEGHAMLVMFAFLAETASGTRIEPELLPNPAEQLEESFRADPQGFGVFQSAPPIIRRSLLFPYVDGAGFVHQHWLYRPQGGARRPPLGEFLPQSTEQVLHPRERFIQSRDEPVELRFTGPSPWRVRYENTMGEFEIGVYFDEHLGTGSAAAAQDWGGDRYRLLEGTDGEVALVWFSVWDTESAADRFANSVQRIAERSEPQRYAVERVTVDERHGVRVVIHATGGDPAAVPTGMVETVRYPVPAAP
jgi:hypothetical protein